MNQMKDDETASAYRKALRDAGPYLTLGLELGLTMVVWTLIGYLLDLWLDTLPWLTLAGILVGMSSLFLQLARAARKSREGARRSNPDGASNE